MQFLFGYCFRHGWKFARHRLSFQPITCIFLQLLNSMKGKNPDFLSQCFSQCDVSKHPVLQITYTFSNVMLTVDFMFDLLIFVSSVYCHCHHTPPAYTEARYLSPQIIIMLDHKDDRQLDDIHWSYKGLNVKITLRCIKLDKLTTLGVNLDINKCNIEA